MRNSKTTKLTDIKREMDIIMTQKEVGVQQIYREVKSKYYTEASEGNSRETKQPQTNK